MSGADISNKHVSQFRNKAGRLGCTRFAEGALLTESQLYPFTTTQNRTLPGVSAGSFTAGAGPERSVWHQTPRLGDRGHGAEYR
jgi:hypothetical protein